MHYRLLGIYSWHTAILIHALSHSLIDVVVPIYISKIIFGKEFVSYKILNFYNISRNASDLLLRGFFENKTTFLMFILWLISYLEQFLSAFIVIADLYL